MSKSIPLHKTELNRNHTLRYVGARKHAPMNGNSKPILPVYRRLHEVDEKVSNAKLVQHNKQPTDRRRASRDKDNSKIIIDRPLG